MLPRTGFSRLFSLSLLGAATATATGFSTLRPAYCASFFSSFSSSSSSSTKYSGGCSVDDNINDSPEAQYASSKDIRVDLNSAPLSDAQILSTLQSANEEKRLPVGFNGISEVHINSYRANYSIEDSYSNYPFLGFFGVYDGHSGSAASNFCRTSLLEYLIHYRLKGWTSTFLAPMTFLHADNHFLHSALSNPKFMQYGLSGACYNVVSIQNGLVTSAAGGDVRAVLGRRDPTSPSGYSTIELSRDHQIDTHYQERERLLSEHVDEMDIIRHNRVKGRLQPTRGMGDGAYKDIRFYEEKKRGMKNPSQVWKPPYTTAEPEIHSHVLTDNDSFVVLATDGLFQELTSQQVVDIMGKYMEQKENNTAKDSGNAATYLIRHALQAASEHSIGRRSAPNANLSWILRLQPGVRRSVHDDITVTVVFLDPKHKSWENEDAMVSAVQSANVPVPPLLQQAMQMQKQQPQPQPPIQSKL